MERDDNANSTLEHVKTFNSEKYKILLINESFKEYETRIGKSTPGVLMFDKPIISNNIVLKRKYIPFDLRSYIKLNEPLVSIEKDWLSYQLINIVSKIHNQRLLHLNIKPQNVLVNSMGIVLLCDMGHHLQDHKFIEKSDTLKIENYLKLKGNDTAYLDPIRVVDKLPSLKEDSKASTYKNETVYSSFDIHPLLVILEKELTMPNYIKMELEHLTEKQSEERNFGLAEMLKNKFAEIRLNFNTKFFLQLTDEILQKEYYASFVIEFFYINWTGIWRNIIKTNEAVQELSTKCSTTLNKIDIEAGKEHVDDIYVLLLNYLYPSIVYCEDSNMKILGLEMMERFLCAWVENKEFKQNQLEYVINRIFPVLIHLLNEKYNMLVRYHTLAVFFKICIHIHNTKKLKEYLDTSNNIQFICLKLEDIFKSSDNECLIIHFLRNMDVFINLIQELNYSCANSLYSKYTLDKKAQKHTETDFMVNNKDIKAIDKCVRIYEGVLKENTIHIFIEKIIKKLILYENENISVALLQALPKLSHYIKDYISPIKLIHHKFKKNNKIIVCIIKILDDILLHDEAKDVISMIIEDLKIYPDQMKICELLKMINVLYQKSYFVEYPLLEERIIFGNDSIFNYLGCSKTASFSQFQILMEYLLKHKKFDFYSKIQPKIIHFFTFDKNKFLLSEADFKLKDINRKFSESNTSARKDSSLIKDTSYPLTNKIELKYSVYDYLNTDIIDIFITSENKVVIFKRSNCFEYMCVLSISKNERYKLYEKTTEKFIFEGIVPIYDSRQCFIEKDFFYCLEDGTNNIFEFNIKTRSKNLYLRVLRSVNERIILFFKVVDSCFFLITDYYVYKYRANSFEAAQQVLTLNRLKGQVNCYDISSDKRKIYFGTTLGYIYCYNFHNEKELVLKPIDFNNGFTAILNLNCLPNEGLLIQSKDKNSNSFDNYIIENNVARINSKFLVEKNFVSEEVSYDISTLCTSIPKVFLSGGKDLIYWDYDIGNYRNSRNISEKNLFGSLERLTEYSCVCLKESKQNSHKNIKKIETFKIEGNYIIVTLHEDGIICIWD